MGYRKYAGATSISTEMRDIITRPNSNRYILVSDKDFIAEYNDIYIRRKDDLTSALYQDNYIGILPVGLLINVDHLGRFSTVHSTMTKPIAELNNSKPDQEPYVFYRQLLKHMQNSDVSNMVGYFFKINKDDIYCCIGSKLNTKALEDNIEEDITLYHMILQKMNERYESIDGEVINMELRVRESAKITLIDSEFDIYFHSPDIGNITDIRYVPSTKVSKTDKTKMAWMIANRENLFEDLTKGKHFKIRGEPLDGSAGYVDVLRRVQSKYVDRAYTGDRVCISGKLIGRGRYVHVTHVDSLRDYIIKTIELNEHDKGLKLGYTTVSAGVKLLTTELFSAIEKYVVRVIKIEGNTLTIPCTSEYLDTLFVTYGNNLPAVSKL